MRILKYKDYITEKKNPCWPGYRQLGTKKKGGKEVPNCVPIKESEDEDSYSFDELSPEAKQKAIESNRDMNVEGYDWWDPIIEGFTEKMENIGRRGIIHG
jgi:hypothetical protein